MGWASLGREFQNISATVEKVLSVLPSLISARDGFRGRLAFGEKHSGKDGSLHTLVPIGTRL